MLTYAAGQTYGFVACGAEATIEHYYVTPTNVVSTLHTTVSIPKFTTSSETTRPLETSGSSVPTEPASTIAGTAGASTTTGKAEHNTGSSTNVGAIVGGAVGGVALICLSAVAIVFIRRKRASKVNASSDHGVDPTSLHPAPSPYPMAPSPFLPAAPPYFSTTPQPVPVYEADISYQKVAWKEPVPGDPTSPAELPSNP